MNWHTDQAADYDVVIVGGGMVGSMLAAALASHSPLTVAVLENHRPQAMAPGSDEPYDVRVSALSIATQRMLENVGAWQGILDRRACPYREMLVWDGEASGQTHFHASDINAPVLGHIVENRVLQLALLDRLNQCDKVDYLCPETLSSYTNDGALLRCELTEGRVLTTRLLIGADGARSSVRAMAGIQLEQSSYSHHALVATVETELPQQDITWQRFQPTGPEAMLPLCGSRASLVWYHSEEEVQRLKALSESAFLAELEASFPERLGRIDRLLERGSFPIVKAHAEHYIADKVALVGDAAHTVHPLAGQGVNLGMLDAAALAEVLITALSEKHEFNSRRVLRRYERWRRGENTQMMLILDGFYHAFKPQPVLVQRLRSNVLDLADKAVPLKQIVMRYAMGQAGDLPKLAQTHYSSGSNRLPKLNTGS